jgi:hypothetical protein
MRSKTLFAIGIVLLAVLATPSSLAAQNTSMSFYPVRCDLVPTAARHRAVSLHPTESSDPLRAENCDSDHVVRPRALYGC